MTTNDNLVKQVTMMVQRVHGRLGHINEREIAKALGWKLTDATNLDCTSCAAGKAKQKLLKKKIVDPDVEKEGYRFVIHQEK